MKEKILVVDDDASVRDSLKRVLEGIGYIVTLAADGQEGVTALEGQSFDLLILDLDLPKLTGFDILDVARTQHPSLPIIVLTGLADQCEPGALVGAAALLEKPPDVPLLLKSMESLLNEAPEQRLRRISAGPTGMAGALPAESGNLRLRW